MFMTPRQMPCAAVLYLSCVALLLHTLFGVLEYYQFVILGHNYIKGRKERILWIHSC